MAQELDPLIPAGTHQDRDITTARLDELLGGRSEREVALVARLVARFPAKASGLVQAWSTATLAGDRQDAVRAVHTLKGTALNLGSPSLTHVCAEIESWSHDGGPDGEAERRERLLAAVAAFAHTLTEVGPTGRPAG